MITKVGNNDYDFCASLDADEWMDSIIYQCLNPSKTRVYTFTEEKKQTVISRIRGKGFSPEAIAWIGECRTKTKNGKKLKFGYASFVKED